MKQFRTVWTTEPNCSLHASCYWFDTESSPMMSKGGSGNQSNTVMFETPTSRSGTIVDHSTTRRVLERVRHLLDVSSPPRDRTGWTCVLAARRTHLRASGAQPPPGMDGARGVSAERALRTLPVLSDCGISHPGATSLPGRPRPGDVCSSSGHVSSCRTRIAGAQRAGAMAHVICCDGNRRGDHSDRRRVGGCQRQFVGSQFLVWPSRSSPRGAGTIPAGPPSDLSWRNWP